MKKRLVSMLFSSLFLLSMIGCSDQINGDIHRYDDIPFEEYLEKVKLPKNLNFAIEPETVPARTTAKVYENVEYMDFDNDVVKDLFFLNPITQQEEAQETPSAPISMVYTAETDTQWERFIVRPGSFHYGIYPDIDSVGNLVSNLTQANSAKFYSFGSGGQISMFNGTFASADQELDFASRAEIQKQAIDLLAEAGITIEVDEIVAYDADTLQTIYEDGSKDTANTPLPQKSDECYWVLFRPLIDGIPLNTYYLKIKEDCTWAFWTSCGLQYEQSGLVSGYGNGLLASVSESNGTEENLLTPAAVLELTKQYYGQGLTKPYTVESMELVYIEYPNEDQKSVLLRPYWLVKTSYQQAYNGSEKYTDWKGNPLEGEIKAYDYNYFDAVTGEYFEGSTSATPYI